MAQGSRCAAANTESGFQSEQKARSDRRKDGEAVSPAKVRADDQSGTRSSFAAVAKKDVPAEDTRFKIRHTLSDN
jgi:hypothetical protein